MRASPLYRRIITASILIPPVVMGILLLPTAVLALLTGLVIALGAWEWAVLVGLPRYGYVALTGSALVVAWWFLQNSSTPMDLPTFGVAVWGLGLLVVWRYPRLPSWWWTRPTKVLAGVLVLVPAWASLIALHGGHLPGASDGPRYTLFLFILVWAADSAAFFTGKKWGNRRLAPRVSPAKTMEGLWGAIVATMAIAAGGAWWLGLGTQQWIPFAGLCVVTLLSSVLGDLFESVIKRTQGAKDSGTLLPGHGGVLDRIDSLTAAAPVFVVGLVWLWRLAT
ncbi:Phosphatidate cytidylyltransferase [Gammaproteobacteria bacterium]